MESASRNRLTRLAHHSVGRMEVITVARRRELGVLVVDCGDVVCIPRDAIYTLVDRLGIDPSNDLARVQAVDQLIQQLGGVECRFDADGKYGVDETFVVDDAGEQWRAVIIGGPKESFVP